MISIGNPLTSSLLQKEAWEFDKYTAVYMVDKNYLNSAIPAANSNPQRTFTTPYSSSLYYLSKVKAETNQQANVVTVTLEYNTEDYNPATLPADSVVETVSTMNVDIRQHPQFWNWDYAGEVIWIDQHSTDANFGVPYNDPQKDDRDTFKDFNNDSDKAGITNYLVGNTQVIYSQYYWAKPGDPKGDVGTLQAPPGYGGSNTWLCVGAVRQKQGDYWVLQKTYQYASNGYNTDIYS